MAEINSRFYKDGKVKVFQKTFIKNGQPYNSGMWYARFLLDDGSYVYKTLSTRSDNEAIDKAFELYVELRTKQNLGVKITKYSFAKLYDEFLAVYSKLADAGEVSQHMLKGVKYSKPYLIGYFGKMDPSAITPQDIKEFAAWRRDTVKDKPGRYGKVSVKTINTHVLHMKMALVWAMDRKRIPYKDLDKLKYKKAENNKRPAFTQQEYVKLNRALRRWAQIGDWEFDEATRTWKHTETPERYAVIPAAVEKPKRGRPKGQLDREQLYYRRLMHYYVMINVNMGLRPGELLALRWRNLSPIKDALNRHNYIISVLESKTADFGGKRDVVGRVSAAEYLDRWRTIAWHTKPEDYIFANADGSELKRMDKLFKKALDYAGLKYASNGDPFTPYSLRHTFATFYLRYESSPDVYWLAQIMGTSVEMIKKHYGQTAGVEKATHAGGSDLPPSQRPKALALIAASEIGEADEAD